MSDPILTQAQELVVAIQHTQTQVERSSVRQQMWKMFYEVNHARFQSDAVFFPERESRYKELCGLFAEHLVTC